MDIKNILYNTVELPVTLEEIRFKAKFDRFITEKKNKIMNQKQNKGNKFFSMCNCILLQSAYNKFTDFFCMGTFIDSTHMKL